MLLLKMFPRKLTSWRQVLHRKCLQNSGKVIMVELRYLAVIRENKVKKASKSLKLLAVVLDACVFAVQHTPTAPYRCLLLCVWCWLSFLACSSLFWHSAGTPESYQNFTNTCSKTRALVFWESFADMTSSDSGK